MQEEINQRTVAISISASKMSARVLQSVLRKFLTEYQNRKNNKQMKSYRGKQTLKQLIKSDATLSNIEITDENIKSFEKSAKKYGIDYALKKDKSQNPPKYIVFFKGKDLDVITNAFEDYTKKVIKKKPSIRKLLVKLKEKAKSINKDKERNKDQDLSL
ncbi:MAG: PcfB family protein [Clostridia bacterium]|nr:PcfB family protein [Clostridia bacterium]